MDRGRRDGRDDSGDCRAARRQTEPGLAGDHGGRAGIGQADRLDGGGRGGGRRRNRERRCRRAGQNRGRQGVRHRSTHRWSATLPTALWRRSRRSSRPPAQAGAAAPHLPGTRLCAQARRYAGRGAGERRGGLPLRGRKADLHPADVPGKIRRRYFRGRRWAVVCQLPERRLSRRSGGSRHAPWKR